ncbi:MAG TPA: efflux transporter periplasmic adaptor subunit, partial [Chitinophagales bacterium]|nr:efflux transporter periplasmic adaptor subunit [Chitinophagales bacterium]
ILPESYKDLMDANGDKYPFYPGMSATVEIKTEVSRDVLAVPIQAVTAREDTSNTDKNKPVKEIVFLMDGDKVKEVTVETGLQDDAYIVIKKGLSEGDRIVSGPYNTITNVLKDGDPVSVDKKKVEPKK